MKNEGGQEGGPSFSGGVTASPCRRGKIRPSTNCELAQFEDLAGLYDLRIVPIPVGQADFSVFFVRKNQRDFFGDENRRYGELLSRGGW